MRVISAAVSRKKAQLSRAQKAQVRRLAQSLIDGFQKDDEAFEQAVDAALTSNLPSDMVLARAEEKIPRPHWQMFREDFWQQVGSTTISGELRSLWLLPVQNPAECDAVTISKALGAALRGIVEAGSMRLCPRPVCAPKALSPERVRAVVRAASEGKMPKGWKAASSSDKRALWPVSVKFEAADCLHEEETARRAMRALLMTRFFHEVGVPGSPLALMDRWETAWTGLADQAGFPDQILEFVEQFCSGGKAPPRIRVVSQDSARVAIEICSCDDQRLDSLELDLDVVPISKSRLGDILRTVRQVGVEFCQAPPPDWLSRPLAAMPPPPATWEPKIVRPATEPQKHEPVPIALFNVETVRPRTGSPFLSREIHPQQPRRPVYR